MREDKNQEAAAEEKHYGILINRHGIIMVNTKVINGNNGTRTILVRSIVYRISKCAAIVAGFSNSLFAVSGIVQSNQTQLPIQGIYIYVQSRPFLNDSSDNDGNFEIQVVDLTGNKALHIGKNHGEYRAKTHEAYLLNGKKVPFFYNSAPAAGGMFIVGSSPVARLDNRYRQRQKSKEGAAMSLKKPTLAPSDTLIFRAAGYTSKRLPLNELTDGIHIGMDTSASTPVLEIAALNLRAPDMNKRYSGELFFSSAIYNSGKPDPKTIYVSITTNDQYTSIVKNQDTVINYSTNKFTDFVARFDENMPPAHTVKFDFTLEADGLTYYDCGYYLVNPIELTEFTIVDEQSLHIGTLPDGIINCNEIIGIAATIKNRLLVSITNVKGVVNDLVMVSSLASFGTIGAATQSKTDTSFKIRTSNNESLDSILKIGFTLQGDLYNTNYTWVIPLALKARLDRTPPKIIMNGGKYIETPSLSNFVDPGFSAIDAFDGDCTDQATIDIDTFGNVLLITYSVTDRANNAAKCERTVVCGSVPIFEGYDIPSLPPIATIKQMKFTRAIIEGDGPDLSDMKEMILDYNADFNSVYSFSISTNTGQPSFYISLVSYGEFHFNEAMPETVFKGTGIPGFDGSYFIKQGTTVVGTPAFLLISKTGRFVIHFEP